MPARPPTPDYLKSAEARARLRAREEDRRQESGRNRFRWLLWVFAGVLLTALVVDLRGVAGRLGDFQRTGVVARKGDAADIAGGLGGARYTDPSGRFSLVPPRNWQRVARPANSFFDVVFQGPHGMDMSIQVVVTNGLTFEKLAAQLRQIERNLAATTHMDYAYVGPHRALKRSAQLFKTKLLLLDFVTGDLAHHVQFSVPPALFDEYEPVFLRLMQTYEPGAILPGR
jgi:hypothetical protein